jgi:PHP family Zn ribbon phosphoesterase
MNDVKEVRVRCPYCGETITIEVDRSVEHQAYVEDCHVCCRPIEMSVSVDVHGNPRVTTAREDD